MSEWTDVDAEEEAFARELGSSLGALHARGSHCPKPDLLLAQSTGVLPPEIAADVAAHAAGCRLCQALSEELAAGVAGPTAEETRRVRARVVAALPRPLPKRRVMTWLWSPAPALAVLAIAAGVTAWTLARQRPADRPAVAQGPALPATRPVAFVLPLDAPAVRVSLSDALVVRGHAGTGRQEYLEALGRALVPYREGDWSGAASRLEALARTHPTSDVLLYLGACRLLLGRHEDAVTTLLSARKDASAERVVEAGWYLAVAYERSGQPSRAVAELRRICDAGGDRSASACGALTKLGTSVR